MNVVRRHPWLTLAAVLVALLCLYAVLFVLGAESTGGIDARRA